MARTNGSEHLRYRYGICLNDQCSKCKSKEVQSILARKDFVCEECGKALRECPPPVSFWGKYGKIIIAVGVVATVVIIGIVSASVFSGGEESKPTTLEVAVAPVDSDSIARANADAELQKEKARADSLAKVAEDAQAKSQQAAPVAQPTSKPAAKPAKSSNSKNLGYAIYKGGLRNGQPDGVNATLTFKTRHVIDSRDPKGRVAEAGDYVIGEFSEGHLVQGIWYGSDNQVKGSVIIGK